MRRKEISIGQSPYEFGMGSGWMYQIRIPGNNPPESYPIYKDVEEDWDKYDFIVEKERTVG